jgi:hypothetical protein
VKTFSRLVLLLGLSISPVSCDASHMVRLRHGIFFGECAGYCGSEIEVSGSDVVYKARDIGRGRQSPRPDTTKRASITPQAWNQLLHSVQESEFLKLNDRYGCPDCADQGGEWIEILFADGKAKKVTFDYNRPPKEVLDIVKKLQAIQRTFNGKPGVLGSAGPIPNEPAHR